MARRSDALEYVPASNALAVTVLPEPRSAVKSIPASFPGATFQKIAKHYRKTLDTMADLPYGMVKEKIVRTLSARRRLSHAHNSVISRQAGVRSLAS